MPIANEIAVAAHMYRQNESMLGKSIAGLTAEEWQSRPNDRSNSMFWIVGHVVWARSMALKFLGSMWTRPWLGLYARGSKVMEAAEYPSLDEVLLGWKEVSAALTEALDTAPAEAMALAAPEKSPSFDGTMGGMVGFLAYHEAYHVGQLAYLRRWLGHDGIVG